jgi:hypothetical protein
MNKHKIFLVLTVTLLAALVGSAAGCAEVAPTGPVAKPAINAFTASPASIDAGQKTTLSWDVSGADTITIQPGIIGTVGSSGSLQLSPPDTITYTLTATNETGSTSGTATITVTPVVAGKPDLVITDIWLSAETVYYKIKNQGDAEAKPTWSALYVYDLEEATGYAGSLAVGEEKTESFNWQWAYQAGGAAGPVPMTLKASIVKVCADAKNDIEESNKGNNCATVIWGVKFNYDFTENAHFAKWRSSADGLAGDLRWGGLPSEENGAAYIFLGDLYTCPQKVSNGWILGRFGDFYSESGINLSREIEVPARAVFTAELGFKQGATSTDGVRVALGYLDETFSLVLFPKMDVYSDGQFHTYKVDLSALEDKKTEFFLWVEAKSSPEGDCVRWVNPMITQE